MNEIDHDSSVYNLITQLCKRFIDKHKPVEHPYLRQPDASGNLNKLRSRAFEILLKKSTNKLDDKEYKDTDPVIDLLKYSFVLKSALGRYSCAEQLEDCLDQLGIDQESHENGVRSVLQFLYGLKSFEIKHENVLDVFHYGNPNPLFPEQPKNQKGPPRYQVYPIETFIVPDRFEAVLGTPEGQQFAVRWMDPQESLSFGNHFRSTTTIGIDTLSTRSEHTMGSMLSASRYTVRLVSTRQFSASSYFLPQIADFNDEEKNENVIGRTDLFSEPEQPWLCVESARKGYETNSEISEAQSTNFIENFRTKELGETQLEIWEDFDDLFDEGEHRTWESLGQEAPKEPPFVTETNEAMLHFERIKQAGFLLLLPHNVLSSLNVVTKIEIGEFLEHIKLLLLGVESSTFVWNERVGFCLARNSTISGLSVEATSSVCREIIHWGGCYKSLCELVKTDPSTGKMQQEGFMFRAMCKSVKELLLYYQAVILRITVDNKDSQALLRLLKNARPVGSLLAEVGKLCRCDRNNRETLGEGLGILSHVYDRVTEITEPRVALVFYSILKSCCEVYFRTLEKWLFEGICEDEYGEFMIKTRPQYTREKGHNFWTKGFAINKNSVPGFIGNLSESILQCGKTVRLLKICDPKNSLTEFFGNSHPSVRVCLSVGMVREQEFVCRDFLNRGEKLLGPNVSFAVAFEEQRRAERERAELVMSAQRDTLLRIKREREETKLEEARNKREFLAELKDQAEKAASRKEREKEAELLKDKKYLEDMNAADEIAKNAEIADKQNTIDYYNELAAEAEKRRIRNDWRARRMKLFDKRMDSTNRTKFEIEAKINERSPDRKVVEIEDKTRLFNPEEIPAKLNIPIFSDDTNKNVTQFSDSNETRPEDVGICEKPLENIDDRRRKKEEIATKKSPRPCVLDIPKTTTSRDNPPANINEVKNKSDHPKRLEFEEVSTMTDSRRNKLKVLEQEYGMTPNNNELNIIVMDAQGNENTIRIDALTMENENTRSNLKIESCRNRNRNTKHQTDNANLTSNFAREDLSCLPEMKKEDKRTEAEKNRQRNMTPTYRDVFTDEKDGNVNFVDQTDLQKNRARVMGHDNRNYRDYDTNPVACADGLTPISQLPDSGNGLTPMSCTTDTFPTSTSDISTRLDNCEDCFIPGTKKTRGTNAETRSTDSGFANDRGTTMADNDFGLGTNSYSKFFGIEEAATPTFESSLTVEDVEMIDNTSLQIYLEKSLVTPLTVQSRLANAAIVKYFIYDCNVLSHFRSLRSFFFLLNGEFAKSLTNSLYRRLYEISVPMELFKTSTLTNFLEQALNSSLSSSYENSERLSLSANDIPSQLQVSNPEFLNSLCLNYKISWPLNIVIDERILQQYSKVFKFLLMVGRVLYVLQEDFHVLKVERKATISSQYHKLQLYRHAMMQFITALHNYLTCSVLHESWTELEKELVNATTIDEIYLTHVGYVKKILSRCMLTSRGEKMRTFLCNIFKVILKFHNRVRSLNWSSGSHVYTRANFDRLENMYKTFCAARTYLAHVANKLARSGYQPHLTHFLNALNINPLYDLTNTENSEET